MGRGLHIVQQPSVACGTAAPRSIDVWARGPAVCGGGGLGLPVGGAGAQAENRCSVTCLRTC